MLLWSRRSQTTASPNRRLEGQTQVKQANAQNNSNVKVPAAAQNLNYKCLHSRTAYDRSETIEKKTKPSPFADVGWQQP